MTRILTTTDRVIDHSALEWRLLSLNGNDSPPEVVLSVRQGVPLNYDQAFADRNRLPARGLGQEHVQQVVLGWSANDQHWHLGLVFKPAFTERRGNRWCGLVHWYDPAGDQHRHDAEESGLALANLLGVPFRVIPPRTGDAPTTPISIAVPPPLPLSVVNWTLRRPKPTSDRLLLERSRAYVTSRAGRLIWYGWWAFAFAGLSIATLTVDLALPNTGFLLPTPWLLPYLGLGAALVIVALFVKNLLELLSTPDHFVIEPSERSISARRGARVLWRRTADQIAGVYVSQVVRHQRDKVVVDYGEINLHLGGEAFEHLISVEHEHERQREPDDPPPVNAVHPLESVDSPLEGIALHLARALGVPCWYDQRT